MESVGILSPDEVLLVVLLNATESRLHYARLPIAVWEATKANLDEWGGRPGDGSWYVSLPILGRPDWRHVVADHRFKPEYESTDISMCGTVLAGLLVTNPREGLELSRSLHARLLEVSLLSDECGAVAPTEAPELADGPDVE